MKNIKEINKNVKRNRKRVIWSIVVATLLLLLVIGGIEAYRILYMPQNLFTRATIDPALLATQSSTLLPTPEPEKTEATGIPETVIASPSVEPTTAPTPGITESNDILNILLIGVDRRPEADGGVGKGTDGGRDGTDPHADVQMIVAINFKEKKVDLISFPRDTFIHNPQLMNGVYKLNATFNVGGGFEAKNGAGFLKVCEGAEYMLGGIPVDYYYAVDFEALVKLVDAIGGVDFDVESASYSRHHKKGMQHMDGQDVLFYVRSRKVGPAPGDLNRINRQKDIMVAIFTQLKAKGKLSMVPDLIGAANSGVFTNMNLEQTLALVNFARTTDPKNIGMHSMVGPSADAARWRWCFTDQAKRTTLIKEVYGLDVPTQVHCSEEYAHWLVNYGFSAIRYLKTAKLLLDYADAHKADFTAEQQKEYSSLAAYYTKMQSTYDRASIALRSTDSRAMVYDKNKLKTNAEGLAKLLGYKEKLIWTYNQNYWWDDQAINEVHVDFN